MFERFKKKWNIESNLQLVIILIVFAITGSSTLYVRKGIFYLLGITDQTDIWIRTVLYILVIFPAYNAMLLVVGFLFGQFKFAWEFEKKMFRRFIPGKKKVNMTKEEVHLIPEKNT
jgi:hypothetical protein